MFYTHPLTALHSELLWTPVSALENLPPGVSQTFFSAPGEKMQAKISTENCLLGFPS